MSIAEKIRGLFRRKPLTEEDRLAREAARDEQRFRKLSQADPRLPDAEQEIDRWTS